MSYIVAFTGLPSSGKSTIINSLLHKRVLQSGVCRTTTEKNLLEDVVIDDGGNKFFVLDLPGICDSEEKDMKFTDMTMAHITNANLIFWVSDVNKAFITTHEVNEYMKIKNYLNKLTSETGTIYDIGIILSKCNMSEKNFHSYEKKNNKNTHDENGELCDEYEDTNIEDMIKKVREKFPDENIILFNAFGRIIHSKKTTQNFKKFIENICGHANDWHTRFSISKFYNTIKERQEKEYCSFFEKKYDEFIKSKLNIDILLNSCDKLLDDNKTKYILEKSSLIIGDNHNFQIILKNEDYHKFQFILKFADKYVEIYKKNTDIITLSILRYLLHILKSKHYSININKINNYNEQMIYKEFFDFYSNLSKNDKIKVLDDYIIKNISGLTHMETTNLYHRLSNNFIFNVAEKNKNKNKMNQTLIEYEFTILNNNSFVSFDNTNYDNTYICTSIKNKLDKLDFAIKEEIVDNIIFTNKYNLTQENRLKIMLMLERITLEKEITKYNIKQKINKFIKETQDPSKFKIMSNCMILYCQELIKEYQFNPADLSIFVNGKEDDFDNIKTKIDKFYDNYNKLTNDNAYIILNKLQILNCLYDNNYDNAEYDFKQKVTSRWLNSSSSLWSRIYKSKKYTDITRIMFKKIFSKQIVFCDEFSPLIGNIYNPVHKYELLFNEKENDYIII
jgi:hypothetical protein